MLERKSSGWSARRQLSLAVLIVMVLYALLLGQQGEAQAVLQASGFTFVSFGKLGGIQVYDLSRPDQPVYVGGYDTTGDARDMVLAGGTLYVADGPGGLRALNVLNPAFPGLLGSMRVEGEVHSLQILGSTAYLAAGELGLLLVDVTYPNNLRLVGQLDTPGEAQAVDVLVVDMVPAGVNDDMTPRPAIQGIFAYVADGRSDVRIVDVSVPSSPAAMGAVDVDGEARDIVIRGGAAFVAAGNFLQVLDLANPANPQPLASFETRGPARKVFVDGTQIYVAAGDGGIGYIDAQNPPGDGQAMSFVMDAPVLDILIEGSLAYVANGNMGLRLMNFTNPARPIILGQIETPGEASMAQVFSGLLRLARGQAGEEQEKVWRTLGLVMFDVLLFASVLFLWLWIFAQFALPVNDLRERSQVFRRLRAYLFGSRGPAIFIQNGEIRHRAHEEDRKGPGVALIDTASAAVFRSEHAITQVAGPGLVFTAAGEYPGGVVDLRPQGRGAGPRNAEDPFATQSEDETDEEYAERQERRYDTSALTRDGVEVVPNIAVVFTLNNQPNEGLTRFGYNCEAVWRAIAHQGVQADAPMDSDQRSITWAWLPVHLAVDLWREYLRKYSLDELFTYSLEVDQQGLPTQRRTAFDTITEMVKARLTQPEVPELDEEGRVLAGSLKPSMEYDLLCERGIKVLGASIYNLRFPDVVESQLVDHWELTWLGRAYEEQSEVERLQVEQRLIGQDLAVKEFASAAVQQLAQELEGAGDGRGSGNEISPTDIANQASASDRSNGEPEGAESGQVEIKAFELPPPEKPVSREKTPAGEQENDNGGEDQAVPDELDQEIVPGMQASLKLLLQGTLKLLAREQQLHPRLTSQKNHLVEIIEWIEKR